MASSERFDAVLRAVRTAWLRGCETSTAQYLQALARWAAPQADGSGHAPRLVVQAGPVPGGAPASTAEFDLAALCSHVRMQPASLSLAFACELRPRRDGSWQLHLVHRDRRWWWTRAPRHDVEIVVDGADDAGGEVRFDGRLWRRFGDGAKPVP